MNQVGFFNLKFDNEGCESARLSFSIKDHFYKVRLAPLCSTCRLSFFHTQFRKVSFVYCVRYSRRTIADGTPCLLYKHPRPVKVSDWLDCTYIRSLGNSLGEGWREGTKGRVVKPDNWCMCTNIAYLGRQVQPLETRAAYSLNSFLLSGWREGGGAKFLDVLL